ncbi:hypothetical protein LCGC14_3061860 [marine sediment metagenome]|uniref:Uncharacterized protein n=1 Tax=marine sediment metagenome TaxID=412755 RepID=A0A0F8WJ69_9ZZZZ
MKVQWKGSVVSVQPRIRLLRSFDERSHSYLGFCLYLKGEVGEREGAFSVGIGKAAQAKHHFRVGDVVSGSSALVEDTRKEPVEYYKTSDLKLLSREQGQSESTGPPWLGGPPDLETYRERGHRRLDGRTYQGSCLNCKWGCRMPVEMIIDHWNPGRKRYRLETFCYGPKSCTLYRAGATRKVPGRRGMTWEEEDWIDEDETSHRDMDE